MEVICLLDTKSTLGEGPSWDEEKEVLYWVDILQKKAHRYDPAQHKNSTVQLDQAPGTIAPREGGDVILALENGFFFYNWISDVLDPIANPESHLPNNRFNDGKCDPAGRFWAGSMDSAEEAGKGKLYCLYEDLSVKEKVNDVSISNGLAWSLDHSFMYYIDTPTQNVIQYDYDIETGEIKNPSTVITFENESGAPDGMTIDEEGMLWIAHFGGAQVSRWDPAKGEKIESVSIPALNVTCCVFGGKDRDELFVTTARKGMSKAELEEYPEAGGLFKVKTKVKGAPTYPFKG